MIIVLFDRYWRPFSLFLKEKERLYLALPKTTHKHDLNNRRANDDRRRSESEESRPCENRFQFFNITENKHF